MLKGNRLYTCINHYAATLSLSLSLCSLISLMDILSHKQWYHAMECILHRTHMLTHIPCCAIILPCFSKSVNISFSLVSSHGRYIIS